MDHSREEEQPFGDTGHRGAVGFLSMRMRIVVIAGLWMCVMAWILYANAPEFAGYVSKGRTSTPGETPNISEGSVLGIHLDAQVLGSESPAAPLFVELLLTNLRDSSYVTVSPFPEWNFNPSFVLTRPDGRSFVSWNSRFGPPPTQQQVVLGPGQNVSKTFDLVDRPPHEVWMEEGGNATAYLRGAEVLSLPGQYHLTVVYRPFYYELMTNKTRAEIALNTTVTFRRSKFLRVAHLGSSDLSFLGTDLKCVFLQREEEPIEEMGEITDSYDLIIFDDIPPEWIGPYGEDLRRAVMENGLSLVFFGGPRALGGNGSSSSWFSTPLGDLLPVEERGRYSEVPSGASIQLIGSAFEGFDVSGLNTIRHLNPVEPRPGASVHAFIGLGGSLICSWPVGKGSVLVCAAPLEEILQWYKGRQFIDRIVQVPLTERASRPS